MRGYRLDPDGRVADEHVAVVYAPRRTRDRFPEANVAIMSSEDEARAEACAAERRYAARVVGPARSSEGFKLFYLVNWLD